MFKAVCFDFDYTLADCTDSIVAGFQHGLTRLGWPSPDRETVRKTVGFMLEDSYSMLTGDLDRPVRLNSGRCLPRWPGSCKSKTPCCFPEERSCCGD